MVESKKMPRRAPSHGQRWRLPRRVVGAIVGASLAALGCADDPSAPLPTPTPNLEALVAAMVAAALPTDTPTPTPDIDATIEARVVAAMAALLNPTDTPTPRPTHTPIPRATRRPTPTPRPTQVPETSLADMVKRVRPAVVRIETGSGMGSGAIYRRDARQIAYVITNYHVVEGYESVTVTVNDSSTYTGAVLGTDSVRDLAVVRICCANFATLRFGDASSLEAGDAVVAMGYPLGLPGEASITRGIVSAKRYDYDYLSEVIQTDAAINPGNSGGPMLTLDGKIIGINTFKIDDDIAQRLGFAISATTAQARIPLLHSSIRFSPTPTITPRPYAAGQTSFGPLDGELPHDPSDGFIEEHSADVLMADFVVEATFANPYAASSNPWDYGFMVRDPGGDVSKVFVVVTSRSRWQAYVRDRDDSESETIDTGALHNFNTSGGGQNHLRLVAIGGRGWFFVNGDLISSLDLSSKTGAGDIAVITGAFKGGARARASTEFRDFTITRLNKRYGPADGRLEKLPGYIAAQRSGVRTRDLMAEATFTNPSGRDWDYGFVIRNPAHNRLEVIGVTGTGSWFHHSRETEDDEYTVVGSGRIPNPDWSLKYTRLLLIALGDSGWLFIDDTLLAELDLSHNLDAGEASVMGDFFLVHQASPEFEDFVLWAP